MLGLSLSIRGGSALDRQPRFPARAVPFGGKGLHATFDYKNKVANNLATQAADHSQGLQLENELVPNGTFNTNVAGWSGTLGATLSNTGGFLHINQGWNGGGEYYEGVAQGPNFTATLVAADLVRVSVDVVGVPPQGQPKFSISGSGSSTLASNATSVSFETVWTPSSNLTLEGCGAYDPSFGYDNVSVRRVLGKHFTAPNFGASPNRVTEVMSGGNINVAQYASDTLHLATKTFAAGELPSDADIFIAIKTTDATFVPIHDKNDMSGRWLYAANSLDAANAMIHQGAGSPTFAINGVPLASVTRGGAQAAIAGGTWKILEVRSADLAAWTSMQIGNYTGFGFTGSIGEIVVCPALSAADRAAMRTELGKKYDLSI